MKNLDNKALIVLIAALSMICFGSIVLLLLPAFSPYFDFSTQATANVGGTIGGICSPVLGIFSSYLLYLALIRQTQSNSEQQQRNQTDLIFSLLDQLDKELDKFYTTETKGTVDVKLLGLEGLNYFAREFRYDYDLSPSGDEDGDAFSLWYEAGQLAIIVDSFNLIESRIAIMSPESDLKHVLSSKISSYYSGKLRIPLQSLSEAFASNPHINDEITQKITDLVQRRSMLLMSL